MAHVSLCCPDCAAVLKLANPPAEKSKVKCPKCGTIFVAAEHIKAPGSVTAVKSKLEAPAMASAKGAAPEDGDEELPRGRKGSAKRDDDDSDAPRKKKAKSAGTSLGLIIGIAAGVGAAAVVLLGVGGGLVWWLLLSPGKQMPKGPEQAVVKGPDAPIVPPANNRAAPPVALVPNALPPQPQPEPQPKPKAEPQPQPKAEPQPQPQPEPPPRPQPKTKGKGRPKTEPRPEPQPEPQPQPKAEPQPAPEREPQPVAGPVDLDKDLLAKVTRATALIRVTLENQAASGSGFLVKSNGETGYIITNFHVIALEKEEPEPQQPQRVGPGRIPRVMFPPRRGPFGQQPKAQPKPRPKITVILNSGTPEAQSLSAEVVAVDGEADLAALRVSGARNLPPAIDVSQDPPIAETQPVYIFGFPKKPGQVEENPTITVGKGTIAGLRRDANNQLIDVHINGIINPGNSGGPVVDAQGRLVGVAVATVPGKQIGFAIPAVELHQMFKGRVASGFVVQLKALSGQIVAIGETWAHDRRSSVRARDTLSVTLGDMPKGQVIPPNEFMVMANVADPMLKVRGASAYFAVTEEVPEQPEEGKGWSKLAKAMPISLKLEDQLAIGSFKLPAGSVLDRNYAFQFSFIDADGKTVFTQPHLVRLTFPKNNKSVTIKVTGIPDEPTRRYIEDTAPGAFGAKVVIKSKIKDSMVMEVDPVPDAKVIPGQIKFGTVTSTQGRTFEVKVDKIDLPLPNDDEVTKAVAELKGTNEKRVIAAADLLGKAYQPLPARRAEVAKALEPHVASKSIWVGGAALRGMLVWGGPENIPAIAAGTENVFTRNMAVLCLARLKDPAAAPHLAKCLTYGERHLAAAALKLIGPGAEEAVIPYLKHKDGWTVNEASAVLQVIGTPACIPALTEVASSDNNFIKGNAANAIKAVKARAGK